MRRDSSVGRLLSRAFGVLVLVIVCSGLAQTTAVLVTHRAVRQLTGHVQPLELANAHLRAVLADAQRGLRGYLITGDRQSLDTYDVARGNYPLALADLHALTGPAERADVEGQTARAEAWWTLAQRQRTATRGASAAGLVSASRPGFQAFVAANDGLNRRLAARAATLRREIAGLETATVLTVVTLTVLVAAIAAVTAVRTGRRITRPLAAIVAVLDGRRSGSHHLRADAASGPVEIRATAAALNALADESDRVRAAEQDVARLRRSVRELGYRIRGHLIVEDAVREAVRGLNETLQADHVLVRLAAPQSGVPALTSLNDEHLDGPLQALARCDIAWLDSGDVWATDDPAPAGDVDPPDEERRAWATAGDGPVLTLAVSGDDECIGALTLIRDSGPAWSGVEMRLAEVIATDLGRAVDLGRQYERDQALLAAIAPAAAKAVVVLNTEVTGPLELLADPEQLDRVLMNLLANAVKFTPPEGTVTVTGRRDGEDVVLVVADTGMGIPEAEQPALFARFFRASNAIHRAIPGTGLGLAIVRTIVDNHGGTIGVWSVEKVGTTVTIRLPAHTPSPGRPLLRSPDRASGPHGESRSRPTGPLPYPRCLG